jgi:chorismate mutase/prephenate dehydratase
MDDLEKLRKKIDEIDLQILELLNRRAEVVLEVGKTKQDKRINIHSPSRERALLKRLKEANTGPFPDDALKALFEEIISASVSLQQPLKAAYLGPPATFTHLAARRQLGSSTKYIPESTIKAVFESVYRGKTQYGVVPIENSSEGAINYTLDMFIDYDLKIAFEILLPISHNLLSKTGNRKNITKIYSHPQPKAQCRAWLENNFPSTEIIEELSTAAAAQRAEDDPTAAAVASELAASVYKLKFVEKGIEDNKTNVTRFLVVAKDSTPKTGRDKTSIMFSIRDKAGALSSILKPFSKHRINLTKIESRPSKRRAWEYIFFVDMQGHIEDRGVKKALNEVKKDCLFMKVLGSYPSAE